MIRLATIAIKEFIRQVSKNTLLIIKAAIPKAIPTP